jgi:hypothetical protein
MFTEGCFLGCEQPVNNVGSWENDRLPVVFTVLKTGVNRETVDSEKIVSIDFGRY